MSPLTATNDDSKASSTHILDLPIDILYCIVPYLDVPSFVALTSTCHALHQPSLSHYASYWSKKTRSTFRVPNQPIVAKDGARWQRLYKLLLTQSRVFTWGHDDYGCLGLPRQTQSFRPNVNLSWPHEISDIKGMGIIADMQCGGWSTNMLSAKGAIWTVGVLDGGGRIPHEWLLDIQRLRESNSSLIYQKRVPLRYPAGLVHPNERYEPATAIAQFSAGRSHILALSDSGRIWHWHAADYPGVNVRFLNVTVTEGASEGEVGHVKKVVAGWNKSSAFIHGAGIVVWQPITEDEVRGESELDGVLILETVTVPLTAYCQPRESRAPLSTQEGEDIGAVESFVCLEDYILFSTSLGRVFASRITWSDQVPPTASHPRQLLLPAIASQSESTPDLSNLDDSPAKDVQGSFRSFAIFTSTGAVLTGNQNMLHDLFQSPDHSTAVPLPLKRIPALQNTSVISLAFGDYHFHALHATGHITSYGTEPRGCGALGLGGHRDPTGRLRGLRYGAGLNVDATLVPHAYVSGRRVWFEPEKRDWITFLACGGSDPVEARERMRMCSETVVQGEVSDWVEIEGRAWGERFLTPDELEERRNRVDDEEEEGLGTAYFALSVTAAGWHSGAVVLVNDDLAAAQRERCLLPAPSPPPDATTASTTTTETETSKVTPAQSALEPMSLSSTLGDWTRWLLGPRLVTPALHDNRTQNPPSAARPGARPQPTGLSSHRPEYPEYGATNARGQRYKWAGTVGETVLKTGEVFPRLRLTDGREMPGSVSFSEWRGERRLDLSRVNVEGL